MFFPLLLRFDGRCGHFSFEQYWSSIPDVRSPGGATHQVSIDHQVICTLIAIISILIDDIDGFQKLQERVVQALPRQIAILPISSKCEMFGRLCEEDKSDAVL